jgi:hypothetical protein
MDPPLGAGALKYIPELVSLSTEGTRLHFTIKILEQEVISRH